MRAPALIALPLCSLIACTHISAEEHAARKAELSGADDSTDDTGQPPDLSGAWAGELVIDLVVNGNDHDLLDDCEGELDATLTPSGESYAIDGSGWCVSGTLITVDATLQGTVDRLLDAAGEITLEYRDEPKGNPPWQGQVSTTQPPSLDGSFTFEIDELGGYDVNGEGTFSLHPTPAR